MFADDTVIYHSNVLLETLNQDLQLDLDAVNSWCAKNYITLNISKSQFVSFGYRKPVIDNFVLKLGDIRLTSTNI